MNKDKSAPTPRHLLDFLGIALAVVIIGAYFLLPFVIQPERGPSTVAVLTESKNANELGLFKTGLEVVPLAALGMLLLGLWNVLAPGAARAISLLMALAGMLALVYYINFFRETALGPPNEWGEGTIIGSLGIAFWIMLGASVAAALQALIPRSVPAPRYRLAKLFGNQESVILFGLLLLMIVIGLANPRYLQERNISDNLAGNAYIAVAALGMTMVIVTGNIDISVGSLVGLLAVISGRLVVAGTPAPLAWLAPLVIGGGFGAMIGFLVAYLRIPSIVVTLGMLSIIKGILIIWAQGDRVRDMPADYFLSQMRPLGIPMPIIIMVVLTIGVALWMRYSATGRAFYALGGNVEAARLSGLSRRRLVMTVFILNGLFVGVASVMYSTQFNIIQATPPPALELSVITASVVGGVSILGGTGTAVGSTMATLLLNFIRSAMVFINVSPFWLKAVQGLLILVTVLADLLRRRRQRL
ncbi:MAG: ABC transporter permease [Chloroflexi bacterium]|nr:ABC transporter permease [Chloroflexota bacterium]